MDKHEFLREINDYLEENSALFCAVSDEIYEYAELAKEEFQSADALERLLTSYGFTVERPYEALPTAFRAVKGSGKTVIGFLCEYDALPGLQQEQVPYPKGNGCSGHGCGHNLLGTGSAAAGIALAHAAELHGLDITVVVYGTPAEERYSGKAIMAEDGAFRDLDVCLGWHPLDHNDCGMTKFKAMTSFEVIFHGKKAHACNCPELGRSALDACELMNVGCNYLREHVDRDSYFHYCYTDGGEVPNIVPDRASVWYYARSYRYEGMKQLVERILKVAQGAAMMTETEMECRISSENRDNKLNLTLSKLAYRCMNEVGSPDFTEEDLAYSREVASYVDLPEADGEFDNEVREPSAEKFIKDNGSSDISEVSWIVPTVNLYMTCYGRRTPNHSWAISAQTKTHAAHAGMIRAAKVLALMGVRLAQDEGLMREVQDEFEHPLPL
ncbi:MAG: amidohydrolase [Enterocloster asparagiformis]|nr:amidohydrolase [Enterocloster asparagiformis]